MATQVLEHIAGVGVNWYHCQWGQINENYKCCECIYSDLAIPSWELYLIDMLV